MSKHLGDFDASTVVYDKFTTFRPSTGAPYTLAGTPALSVYKDNSTTQSTTGVTLTVDFDSVTGLHHYAIDTSADGTFYSAGSFFTIVITTGTVDSVSAVGTVVGAFTLRKNSALKPTTAGRTLDVSSGGEAGLDWANVGSPTTSLALTGTTIATTQKVDVDTIKTNPVVNGGTLTFPSGATLASTTNITAGTITTCTNLTNAATSGDLTATMKTSVTTAATAATPVAASVTGNVGGNVTGSVGSIATGGITTASFFAGATIPRCTLVDTTTTNTDMRGTDSAYLAATGTSDRAAYWNPSGAALVRLELVTTLTYGSCPSQSGMTTSQVKMHTGASATDDEYNGCAVVWNEQVRTITDYVGATKVATVSRAWITQPDGSGTLYIQAKQDAPIDSAGKFTNDTAQGTDLTAVANDVDAIYTLVNATGVQISDAHIDQIADTTLRRTMANVELSSYGNTISMGSLYGLVQQAQESNTTAHANKLTIFKTDGTTELGQRTIATDAAADPITGVS